MPSIDYSMPAYRQIARHYAEQIARGELSPGDRLPSERELIEAWAVSKATASKAVAALKSEGLIQTQVGVGTVVSSRARPDVVGVGPNDMFVRLRQDGRIRLPGEVSARTTGERLGLDAPPHVVAALGGTDQSSLVWRRRVIARNQEPFSVAVSWFLPAVLGPKSAAIAERLLDDEPIPEGTPRFVADQLGRDLSDAGDNLSAIPADEVIAADLLVRVGSPVLYIVSTIYADSWPVEVGEYFYRSETGVHYRYQV